MSFKKATSRICKSIWTKYKIFIQGYMQEKTSVSSAIEIVPQGFSLRIESHTNTQIYDYDLLILLM